MEIIILPCVLIYIFIFIRCKIKQRNRNVLPSSPRIAILYNDRNRTSSITEIENNENNNNNEINENNENNEINKYNNIVFKAIEDLGSSEWSVCSICLEPMCKNQNIQLLSCGHFFHDICLNEWFLIKKKNLCCPMCNFQLG